MASVDILIILILTACFILLTYASLRLRRPGDSVLSPELLRQLAQYAQRNEQLQQRVAELESEMQKLRRKLDEAESEIAALRAIIVHFARTEPSRHTKTPSNALMEERDVLVQTVAQLRLHMAKYGEDVFIQNRIEAMEKRIREIEEILDRTTGA